MVNLLIIRPLDNDEAVELLQAEALSLKRPILLAPSYPGGSTDNVEAFPLFVHRIAFIWPMSKESKTREEYETLAHLVHVAVLAATAVLLFLILQPSYGPRWAAAGSLLWSTSSYVLLLNQILTRNTWSPFWLALAFLAALRGWQLRSTPRVWLWWALILPVSLFFGIWSYTLFKAATFALFGAVAWQCLRARDWRSLAPLAAGGALLVLALVGFVLYSGLEPEVYLSRGNYAFGSTPNYWKNFLRCVLMTFWWFKGDGTFLTEGVHDSVHLPLLPYLLAPFFVSGIAAAIFTREFTLRLAAGTIALALPFLAVAGPNLKYPYGLTPLMFVVVIGGAHTLVEICQRRTPVLYRVGKFAAPVLAAAYVALSAYQIGWVYADERKAPYSWEAEVFAKSAATLVDSGGAPIWIFIYNGFDVFRWKLIPWERYQPRIRVFFIWEEVQQALEQESDLPRTILCRRGLNAQNPQTQKLLESRRYDPLEAGPSTRP